MGCRKHQAVSQCCFGSLSPHFRTNPSLFSPRKLHSGMKTYGCELCGKRFLDSLRLRMHLLAHSGGLGGGAGLGMGGCSVCPPRDAVATQLTRLLYSRYMQSWLHPSPGSTLQTCSPVPSNLIYLNFLFWSLFSIP